MRHYTEFSQYNIKLSGNKFNYNTKHRQEYYIGRFIILTYM